MYKRHASRLYDWTLPTAEMVGEFRPFTDDHASICKEQIRETGQVCIQVRSTSCDKEDYEEIKEQIKSKMNEYGVSYRASYIIIRVPNIVTVQQITE